ncbi:MAG: hypothetical protein AB7K09_03520 [Planctomycetota bacterium]
MVRPVWLPALLLAVLLLAPSPAVAQDPTVGSSSSHDQPVGEVFSLRLFSLGGGGYTSGIGGFFDLSLLGVAWTWGMEIRGSSSSISRSKSAEGLPLTFGLDLLNVQLGGNLVAHGDIFFDKTIALAQGGSAWTAFSIGARTGLAVSFVDDTNGDGQTIMYLPILAELNLRILFADSNLFVEVPFGPAIRLNLPSTVPASDAPDVVFLAFIRVGFSLDG